MKKYENLMKPIKVGSITLKNRFAVAPLGSFFLMYGPKGEYNFNAIEYLVDRARGGFGLITLGAIPCDMLVDKPNLIDGQVPPLYAPKTFHEAARRLTNRVHVFGTKIFMQISMGHGRMRDTEKAPSPIPKLHFPDQLTEELTAEEIQMKIDQIVKTAAFAKTCGFDGVEVHAMHWGYLLDQFAMAITNHRTDEYGGDLEHRLTAARKIVEGIKAACGQDFPVSMRMGLKSYMKDFNKPTLDGSEEAGRTLEESIEAAKLLEKFGYDMLNVNSGVYDSFYYCAPPAYIPKGYNLKLSKEVKKAISIPIFTAGRMDDPDMCEQAVANGETDGVALARATLAEPHYAQKVMMGRTEDIHPCISCQNCMMTTFSNGSPTCAVNPAAMKDDFYMIEKALVAKHVIVIGGGVAGMEAARVATMRGHHVELFERTGELGGRLYEAGVHSFKDSIRELNAWYKLQMEQLGIKVHLNTEMTPAMVQAMGADAVILAVGADPVMPRSIPGIDSAKSVSCVDVLRGKHHVGDHVIIVGGGLVGAEMAYDYGLEGKKVTLVEALDDILANDPAGVPVQVHDLLGELLNLEHVNLLLGHRLEGITDKGAVVSDHEGIKSEVEADDVIIAIGFRCRPSMAYDLMETGAEVYEIAAGNGIGSVLSQVSCAYEIARKL